MKVNCYHLHQTSLIVIIAKLVPCRESKKNVNCFHVGLEVWAALWNYCKTGNVHILNYAKVKYFKLIH